MDTQEPTTSRTHAIWIACAVLTLGSLASAGYFYTEYNSWKGSAEQRRAELEKVKALQQASQERFVETRILLDGSRQHALQAHDQVAALELDLQMAEARAASLSKAAGRQAGMERDLAELQRTAQDLRDQLVLARELELDLRTAVDRANVDRDLLAHQLEQREAGARMVNNAELAALHGKKGKLTVKARRTNAVHMAFDLPGSLATAAQFTMTGPNGKHYSSGSPVVSASRDRSDATASVGLSAKVDAADLSRVDLEFRTKEKLEPRVYRIEVRSGKDYLQTVFLNLR